LYNNSKTSGGRSILIADYEFLAGKWQKSVNLARVKWNRAFTTLIMDDILNRRLRWKKAGHSLERVFVRKEMEDDRENFGSGMNDRLRLYLQATFHVMKTTQTDMADAWRTQPLFSLLPLRLRLRLLLRCVSGTYKTRKET
jgi:hypothetical protein